MISGVLAILMVSKGECANTYNSAGAYQQVAACFEGCACREHIINEQDMLILKVVAWPDGKDAGHILPAEQAALIGLRGRIVVSEKYFLHDGLSCYCGNTIRKEYCLVISPLL